MTSIAQMIIKLGRSTQLLRAINLEDTRFIRINRLPLITISEFYFMIYDFLRFFTIFILRPNLPWYNYLTTEIPRAQRPHSVYPPPMIRSKSASNLDENFQRRMTVAQQHQSGSDSEVVYRKDQAPKEQKNRQSVNGHYQTPQTPQTYEPRPQLRSAMRNSRYQ